MTAHIDRLVTSQSRAWMVVVAVALFVGMLEAFHQVVLDAVEQAALRHKANALVVEAAWRCNSAPPSAASTCSTQPSLARPHAVVYVADAQLD